MDFAQMTEIHPADHSFVECNLKEAQFAAQKLVAQMLAGHKAVAGYMFVHMHGE